jgi:cadmium resistance protein CadD (predicted permease)
VNAGVIGAAAGLFAVTNIDDIVVLSLFFAQGAGHRGSAARVVAGQYLGFTAILAVAIAAAVGATFLPEYPCPAPLDHQGISGLVTEPAPASGK